MQYRRHYHKGASYLSTVNLADRSSDLLVKEVETLYKAFKTVKQKNPFNIDAIVIMLCTMPIDDADYSERIKLIKYYFSHRIAKTERILKSRQKKANVVFGNVGFGSIAFVIKRIIVRISITFI